MALLPLLVAADTPPALYTIHTYAGTTWTGDGRSATSAVLIQPSGIALDGAGNLYIADAGDHRVRCVGRDGAIRTVAGTGAAGFTGNFEPATSSALNTPYGVAADQAGNLFVADLGNALVRRVGTDGRMITIAGGGAQAPSPVAAGATSVKLTQPRDVAVDRRGNVFISDFGAHQVYQVTPDGSLSVVAGTGQPGAMGGPSVAIAAQLSGPAGLALDSNGILYIADSANRRIRKLSGGVLTTLADRDGKEVELGTPTGLSVDSGNRLYIADGSSRLTVVWSTGEFLSLGIGGTAVALGAGGEVLTIADRQILRLTGASTAVVAGSFTGPGAGDGRNPSEWRFQSPAGIVRDTVGNLYIADTGNGRVRRMSASGELSTLTTKLAAPTAVALDSQSRLYAGDRATGSVYRIDPGGQLRLIARSDGRTMTPSAMVFDPLDNLYIADSASEVIRRVAADGTMTVVAGGGTLATDGVGLLLKLGPVFGLAFDADGGLWFSESSTGRLRRFLSGRVTTLQGTALKEPRGIRFDASGQLLVCDAALHRVIRVAPDGSWMPLAGSGDKGLSGDGDMALAGMLNTPVDVVLAEDGNLLVADAGNNRIRVLKPQAMPPDAGMPPSPEIKTPTLSVLHAGTLKADPVAPGQLVYIAGEGLARAQVSFGTALANVIAATAERLTVQVPASIRPGVVEVSALEGKDVRGKAAVDVAAIVPAILTAGGGRGQALAVNDDGQPNGMDQPVGRNSIVSLFLTGDGGGTPKISAVIGGYAADVLWAGPAPGLPGISQVNVRMPGGFAPSGVIGVVLTVDGVRTQPGVTIVSR